MTTEKAHSGDWINFEVLPGSTFFGSKKLLISSPQCDRVGRLLSSSCRMMSGFGMCILMEQPLNEAPSDQEHHIAKGYLHCGVPNHVLFVPIDLLNVEFKCTAFRRWADVPKNLPDFPSCVILKCQIPGCNKYVHKRNALISCRELNHISCLDHILPINKSIGRPDLLRCNILSEAMASACLARGYASPCMDTRTMLAFNGWDVANSQRKDQIVRDFVECDCWTCEVCVKLGFQNPNFSPFRFFHDQLFDQVTNGTDALDSSDPENFGPGRSNFPIVFNKLLALNVGTGEEIEAVLSGLNPADEENYNTDLLRMLIVSNRDSNNSNTGGGGGGTTGTGELSKLMNEMSDAHNLMRLSRNMLVHLVCPETRVRVDVMLKKDYAYMDISMALLKYSSMHVYVDAIVVHRVDADGWSTELCQNQLVQSNGTDFCILDLSEGDVLSIRRVTDGNVGAKITLEVAAATEVLDAPLQNKLKSLSHAYKGYRKIRGDGNCYYRAIIFGILEQIVESQRPERLKIFNSKLRAVTYAHAELIAEHEKLMNTLQLAADGTIWLTVEELEADILSPLTGLDLALNRACRQLVAQYLIVNEQLEMNGLQLRDAILPCFEDVSDINQYCEKYITTMGVDAEGVFIELGLLPRCLDCGCTITYLDRIEGNELKSFSSCCDNQSVIAEVHIMLRPGHYDLLYVRNAVVISKELDSIASSSQSLDPNDVNVGVGVGGGPPLSTKNSSSSKSSKHLISRIGLLGTTLMKSFGLGKPPSVPPTPTGSNHTSTNSAHGCTPPVSPKISKRKTSSSNNGSNNQTQNNRTSSPFISDSGSNSSSSNSPRGGGNRQTAVSPPVRVKDVAQQLSELVNVSIITAQVILQKAPKLESAVSLYYENELYYRTLDNQSELPFGMSPSSSPIKAQHLPLPPFAATHETKIRSLSMHQPLQVSNLEEFDDSVLPKGQVLDSPRNSQFASRIPSIIVLPNNVSIPRESVLPLLTDLMEMGYMESDIVTAIVKGNCTKASILNRFELNGVGRVVPRAGTTTGPPDDTVTADNTTPSSTDSMSGTDGGTSLDSADAPVDNCAIATTTTDSSLIANHEVPKTIEKEDDDITSALAAQAVAMSSYASDTSESAGSTLTVTTSSATGGVGGGGAAAAAGASSGEDETLQDMRAPTASHSHIFCRPEVQEATDQLAKQGFSHQLIIRAVVLGKCRDAKAMELYIERLNILSPRSSTSQANYET